MRAVLFPCLLAKHTISTPIAIAIPQARRQIRKIFHKDKSVDIL
jgi:hypothetical protein